MKRGIVLFLACSFMFACSPTTSKPDSTPTSKLIATVEVTETVTFDDPPTAIGPEATTQAPDKPPTLDAVVITPEASEDEIDIAIATTASRAPFLYNENTSTYELTCVLENINFLNESAYIPLGDHEITVKGECGYRDFSGKKQTVTVALVIQDPVNKITWMPYSEIQPFITKPNLIQDTFSQFTRIEAGSLLVVSFGPPNQDNRSLLGGEFNADAASALYTAESIAQYVRTGNSDYLNGNELIPFSVVRSGLQPLTNSASQP